MDARELFLDQHAAMHSAAVGGNKMSAAERTFAGLSDEQMRVRPREDLNSLAWLMWHIARAEDIIVNSVLSGQPQVFGDAWMKRLGIGRRDFGIGMTSAEVTELTKQIDVGALREYRDAVGRRTREMVSGFTPADWEVKVATEPDERVGVWGAYRGPPCNGPLRPLPIAERGQLVGAAAGPVELLHAGPHALAA